MTDLYQRLKHLERSFRCLLHPYADEDPNPARAVLLSGAPRSGTTWLAETLNYNDAYRYMYEPFNRGHVPLCRDFSIRQYMRPDDCSPQYLEVARAILSGRIRGPWVDQYNKCKNVKRRLIKDVRSTLMLKWIRHNFLETRIIYLVRHPCAVALSRMRLGYSIDVLEKVYLTQPNLVKDYLAPFVDKLKRADSIFDRHIANWCIENYVPLAQLGKGDVYLAFYELLVTDPASELRRLFDFLKQPFDDLILKRLRRPSVTSRKSRGVRTLALGEGGINSWEKHLTAAELKSAHKILETFGLAELYDKGSVPDIRSTERWFMGTPERSELPSNRMSSASPTDIA